jgi:hemolysin-activating ACP:hemolysin acyltransferase
MRDPVYRQARIAHLETMVVPAVVSGQWRVGHSPLQTPRPGGSSPGPRAMAPVAAVLWASVSDEVDKQLSDPVGKSAAVTPDQWSSGGNLWIMVAAGEKRGIARVIQQLRKSNFKDRPVKFRTRGPDGKVRIETFKESVRGR